MKRTLIMILCAAFCFVILSCGTTGGGGGGGAAGGVGGVTVPGNWTWDAIMEYSDGNDSTAYAVEAEEVIDGQTVRTYTLHGTVTNTIEYGLSSVELLPDEETLELLKTCTAISFKLLGDGKRYIIEAPISAVRDWGFHARNITTEEGVVTEFHLPMRTFSQPGWASQVRFNQALIEKIIFKTRNNREGGLGDWGPVKIWDLKLHM